MIELILYGSGTSEFEYLREEISEYLNEMKIPSNWIEVSSVDEFIRNRLVSVPAVKVNDQFIEKNTNETTKEFAFRVRDQLNDLNARNMAPTPKAPPLVEHAKVEIPRLIPSNKKRILIPFDRNKHSLNAIHYALQMSGENDEIHVFHALLPILPVDEHIPINSDDQIIQAKHEIENLISKIPLTQIERTKIKVSVKIGMVVPQVREKLAEGFDAIIMGTRNKYQMIDKIFGTISLGITKQKSTPLMLVGAHTKYQKIERILIGCDKPMIHEKGLKAICDWNKDHHAHLIFAHVSEGSSDFFIDEEAEFIQSYFKKNRIPYKFEVNIIEKGDVARQLIVQTEKKNADLLLTIPSRQSFLSSLLLKSVSKDLIMQAQVPLLFL